MKVILKAVSHPGLGDIDIVDDLFSIGRNEEPFASRFGDDAAHLSRRHARVFQEGGEIFVADLGSRNGTRVNGRELRNKAATLLHHDDCVTFGDTLEFRVEIGQTASQGIDKKPAIRLALVPEDAASGLETIAIESFPFLISRNEGEFAQYQARLPTAWRRLSRRHAVIALKGGRINVEDLGSSNGTFLSGGKLDERARELADGDVVAFGDPQFSYKVHIEQLHEPTRLAGTLLGRSDQVQSPGIAEQPASEQPSMADHLVGASRTRFVSSANSFINVFCSEGDAKATGVGTDAPSTLQVERLKRPVTRWGKLRNSAGQLWRALGGGDSVDRRFLWGAAGVLGAIAIVAASTYLLGLDRREIKDLLDDRQYSESARAANSYLKHHSDDLEASAWAEEALTREVVPVWVEHMDQGRFAEATKFLAAQREAHPFIPRGLQMIDTLAWAGKVEAHLADRGGASGPIVLFRHEQTIRSLVQEWGAHSFRRQQIMDQILSRVPEFEHIHTRIFSSLTSLRSDNSLYVKAIEELKAALQAALERDDRPAIAKLIRDFGSNYPRVSGVDTLRDDLARYDTLHQLAQQKELLQLVHLRRTAQFRTPIFSKYVDAWLAKELPSADIIARYAEAASAWNIGNHDEAIATLQSVKDAPWGEVATRQIARYQKIGADYDALVASKGSDDYYDHLLVVWSTLRPDEDQHLIRTLEPDFVAHREQVLPRLDKSLGRVRAYWSEYQSAGGISGVTRVEARVSSRFSGQAKRLASAYQEISSGARTYQLLQVTPPPEWQTLQREVVGELQRQRRWLQDLNIVLEPVLLHAKLELLPEISEQSLWVQSTTDQKRD